MVSIMGASCYVHLGVFDHFCAYEPRVANPCYTKHGPHVATPCYCWKRCLFVAPVCNTVAFCSVLATAHAEWVFKQTLT